MRERQYVPCLGIDTLLESQPAPAFVEIDVEGAEALVLEGARKLLGEIRPILYVEVATSNRSKIEEMMREFNYEIFSPAGASLTSITEANVFLLHHSRREDFVRKAQTLKN